MDFKIDVNATCKLCGNGACRVYKIGDNYIKYKCYSGCGEYIDKGELDTEGELVDTKPIKF